MVSDFRCVGLDPALALMVHLSVTRATTVFEIISLMNAEVKVVLTYMTLIALFNVHIFKNLFVNKQKFLCVEA